MVGPFIFADMIGPDRLPPGQGIDVNAHPHIGLATVTCLLAGRMVHRDSTGAVQVIEPGAVNWMTAGAGVTHTERSHPDDRPPTTEAHGLQTWVALPVEAEDGAPSFQHLDATQVPVERLGLSSVRLAVGTGWGLESPVAVSSPLVLAHLELDPGSPVVVDDAHPERARRHSEHPEPDVTSGHGGASAFSRRRPSQRDRGPVRVMEPPPATHT